MKLLFGFSTGRAARRTGEPAQSGPLVLLARVGFHSVHAFLACERP